MTRPTVTYPTNPIARNGSDLTASGVITDTSVDIGEYYTSGTFDIDVKTTWERLLLHPWEDAGNINDDDYYDITIDAVISPTTMRGKRIVSNAYLTWNAGNSDYEDDNSSKPLDEDWTSATIEHQIDWNVDDLHESVHTFVFTAVGNETAVGSLSTPPVESEMIHDFRPILVQITPTVSINTSTLTTATLANNTVTATESNGQSGSITFNLDHEFPNENSFAATPIEGEGAWIWYKEGVYDNQEDLTFKVTDGTTAALTYDSGTSETVSYELRLFIPDGFRSGFTMGESPRTESVPYDDQPDRTITVNITFS